MSVRTVAVKSYQVRFNLLGHPAAGTTSRQAVCAHQIPPPPARPLVLLPQPNATTINNSTSTTTTRTVQDGEGNRRGEGTEVLRRKYAEAYPVRRGFRRSAVQQGRARRRDRRHQGGPRTLCAQPRSYPEIREGELIEYTPSMPGCFVVIVCFIRGLSCGALVAIEGLKILSYCVASNS